MELRKTPAVAERHAPSTGARVRIARITRLPHSHDDVVAWHERPGALVRLTPPGLASLEKPGEGGIEVGRRVAARLGPPVLPDRLRPRWVLRHAALDRSDGRTFFEDRQVTGPFRLWRQEHLIETRDAGSSDLVEAIDAELPAAAAAGESFARNQVERVLTFRAQQLADDLAFHRSHARAPRLTVAMTGATGLIGTQLAALLETGGHTVRRMVRRPARRDGEISWDPERGILDPADLEGVDAVVHLGGRSIATRMTPRAKQEILSSRVASSELIARTIAGMADGPRTLVQASAIGYYGAQRPGELLREDSAPGDDVLAQVCRAWEGASRRTIDAGVRTVHVRTGIVLSDGGGALLPQLPLFLLGAGGRMAPKDTVTSWITLDDLVRAYAHALLAPALEGPLNAVAPHPVTAAKMAAVLGRVLHRPAVLSVPAAGPAALLGREGARVLVRADQRVSDARLRESGFEPAHADLETALRHVLRR